jgi:predicted metal-dependent hydrolase
VENVKIDGIEIPVQRKKIKNLYVKINSLTGGLEVTASSKMKFSEIENFLRSKINWIKKHQSRIALRPAIRQNEYFDGGKILLFGKEKILRVFDHSGQPKVFSTFDGVDLYISASSGEEERKNAVDGFYQNELAKTVPAFINKWLANLGIKISNSISDKIQNRFFGRGEDIETSSVLIPGEPEIVYKRIKRKWGVCNISENRITLNPELAKKTPRCIEYVTAHELLHFKERSHNKSFRRCMKKFFPDWKNLEEELRFL